MHYLKVGWLKGIINYNKNVFLTMSDFANRRNINHFQSWICWSFNPYLGTRHLCRQNKMVMEYFFYNIYLTRLFWFSAQIMKYHFCRWFDCPFNIGRICRVYIWCFDAWPWSNFSEVSIGSAVHVIHCHHVVSTKKRFLSI